MAELSKALMQLGCSLMGLGCMVLLGGPVLILILALVWDAHWALQLLLAAVAAIIVYCMCVAVKHYIKTQKNKQLEDKKE